MVTFNITPDNECQLILFNCLNFDAIFLPHYAIDFPDEVSNYFAFDVMLTSINSLAWFDPK